MTGYDLPVTSSTRTVVRRLGTLSAASLSALVLLATPAMADVPVGWANDPHVSPLKFLIVLVLIPIALALVIGGLVLMPGILKGEGLFPKPFPKPEPQAPSSHH